MQVEGMPSHVTKTTFVRARLWPPLAEAKQLWLLRLLRIDAGIDARTRSDGSSELR